MDFPGSVQNFMYLLSKLGQQDRLLSEWAIEYFWSSLLLKKLSQNVMYLSVLGSFSFSRKSGQERADLMEMAVSELTREYPEFSFMNSGCGLSGAFKEDSPLFHRTCAYADDIIDSLSLEDIGLVCGPLYSGMFSTALDSGLLYSDVIVPIEILEMMIELLEIEPGMSVYDPAFGYGRAFYKIFTGDGFERTSFAGLEIDPRKYRLAKTVLALLGIDVSKLRRGDSIVKPSNERIFFEEKYDRVIIEPPAGEKMIPQELKTDVFLRRLFGVSSGLTGQWDFIDHGIRSTSDTGKLATLSTLGELGKRHEEIVDNDWLEAVIELPARAVHGSYDRGCIMLLNKAKPRERRGEVFMASCRSDTVEPFCFEVREENLLLDSVMRNFKDWKGESGVCATVPIGTIKRSGYFLIPGNYLMAASGKDLPVEELERLLNSPMVELRDVGELLETARYMRKRRDAVADDALPAGPLAEESGEETCYRGRVYVNTRLRVDVCGTVLLDSLKEYNGDLARGVEKVFLQKGDIVFTRLGDVTTVGIVGEIPADRAILPSIHHTVLRTGEGYNPVKVFNAFRSDYGRFLIEEAARDTFMEMLPGHKIGAMRLPVHMIGADKQDRCRSRETDVQNHEGRDADVQ